MLSAQLDGEGDAGELEMVDEHLAGCADCRTWLDRAATVNRLTRTGPATSTPDLSAAIMAAFNAGEPAMSSHRSAASVTRTGRDNGGWPAWTGKLSGRGPGWVTDVVTWLTYRRMAALLYLALAAVGAVQLILGLDQVGGGVTSAHVHAGTDATAGHLWHESAAWNVAVGAGYLFIALRRNRPSGLVPMLTAFVGMLLLLSLNDLTADRVDSTRLVSHGFVILGYLLVVALSKVTGHAARPPGARVDGGTGSSWRAHFTDDEEAEEMPRVPALRLVPRHPGPLTADHDEPQAA